MTIERAGLLRRLRESSVEGGDLAANAAPGEQRPTGPPHRNQDAEQRVTWIDNELAKLAAELVDESDVVTALADFDALWAALAPLEQFRVVDLLVEQVVYDGDAGSVAITFRTSGIKTLAAEIATNQEEAA